MKQKDHKRKYKSGKIARINENFNPVRSRVKPRRNIPKRDHKAEVRESENEANRKLLERYKKRMEMINQGIDSDGDGVGDEPLKIAWKITSILSKTAFRYSFPQASVPIQAISSPEKIEKVYENVYKIRHIASDDPKKLRDAKNALNETLEDVAKYAVKGILDKDIQKMVECSSEYLEENEVFKKIVQRSSEAMENKKVFKEITKSFELNEYYAKQLKDFYEKSLSGCLKEIKNEIINSS